MFLEYTCTSISKDKWNELMKGHKPLSYRWIKNKIRREIPELYESLMMDFYNPWENDTFVTKTHYIVTNSAIEYFIHK